MRKKLQPLPHLAIVQQQQAKSWEQRAATSLARPWKQQGKVAEAHKLLASVCHWSTEGFNTVDLKDAKVLLDELVYLFLREAAGICGSGSSMVAFSLGIFYELGGNNKNSPASLY